MAKKPPVKRRSETVAQRPSKFELIFNRKKFNVLGKKVKGEAKSRIKAKSDSTEKRKSTLLVEHKQRQRANAFLDRRFGEDDASLTADDRAIARFQKQRLKEFAGSKFALDEPGEDNQLTHLGATLADYGGSDQEGFFDEDQGLDMDYDAVGQLHFGGGFTQKEGINSEATDDRPKTKKQVMEEIMAKSKKAKAEKTKQREEDLDAIEALDKDLSELTRDKGFQKLLRPKGMKQKAPNASADDAAFDVLRREMIFEAKGKAGERLKTAEELETAELARLQNLERQRQLRMSGDDLGGPESLEDKLPAGGYARKRAKRQREEEEAANESGSEPSDKEEEGDGSKSSSEGDEGETRRSRKRKLSLDERRAERAAGTHPLQQQFKKLSSRLLKKHTGQASGDDDEDNGELPGSQSEHEGDSSCSEDERSGTNSEASNSKNSEAASEDEATESEGEGLRSKEKEQPQPAKAEILAAASAPGRADLPFIIPLPSTYTEFADLVAGRNADELTTAVRRIRVSNKAALHAEGKKGLQVITPAQAAFLSITMMVYGILVQHFANQSGGVPPNMPLLDALAVQILELTPAVPLYAATTALARLKRMQENLAEALQNPESGSGWPSQRQMLLLKLWATIFQASDRRHPVLTPASLILGACLRLSPVNTLADVLAGLFLSSLGLHMSASATRWMPEPLLFCLQLVQTFRDQATQAVPTTRGWTVDLWLKDRPLSAADAVPLTLGIHSRGDVSQPALTASCLKAAVGLIARTAELHSDLPSFPEVFAPALGVLKELHSLSEELPKHVNDDIRKTMEAIEIQSQQLLGSRRPLQKVKITKEIKQFNPRFEEDFAQEKDYDVDRDRAEARKLKRMVTKERRGAMRELRKDAAFMGVQTTKEKNEMQSQKKKTLRANSAWLQKVEEDFKSGGQRGMWKKKGRK